MRDERAVIIAAALAVLFITALTLASELFPPLTAWLKAAFSHHWIGKSVLSVVFFAGAFFALFYSNIADRRLSKMTVRKASIALAASVVIGFALVFSYFVFSFLKGA